jgi:hypothetical protein
VTVGPFVREQIRARLQQALCIADNGLGGQLAQFRRLLAEVSDRVEGLELTATATANAQAAQPSSSLSFAAFATARGEPVTEFLLIPFGEVVVERPIAGDSFVFTRSHAEAAKQWFDRMGPKLRHVQPALRRVAAGGGLDRGARGARRRAVGGRRDLDGAGQRAAP